MATTEEHPSIPKGKQISNPFERRSRRPIITTESIDRQAEIENSRPLQNLRRPEDFQRQQFAIDCLDEEEKAEFEAAWQRASDLYRLGVHRCELRESEAEREAFEASSAHASATQEQQDDPEAIVTPPTGEDAGQRTQDAGNAIISEDQDGTGRSDDQTGEIVESGESEENDDPQISAEDTERMQAAFAAAAQADQEEQENPEKPTEPPAPEKKKNPRTKGKNSKKAP
jgi:hypothetical protein